jgi:hypothetical protein
MTTVPVKVNWSRQIALLTTFWLLWALTCRTVNQPSGVLIECVLDLVLPRPTTPRVRSCERADEGRYALPAHHRRAGGFHCGR